MNTFFIKLKSFYAILKDYDFIEYICSDTHYNSQIVDNGKKALDFIYMYAGHIIQVERSSNGYLYAVDGIEYHAWIPSAWIDKKFTGKFNDVEAK